MIDQQYLKPDWSDKNRVHNWKNWVSDEVQQIWDSFTDEQKSAIGRMAEDRAASEIWE